MTKPIVVIGGGISGISCVQTLIELLPNKEIVLITSSNLVKVTNNVVQYGMNLIRFDVENQDKNVFQTNYPNVKLIINKVEYINSRNKFIKLTNNEDFIYYDRLAICTGASPKTLNVNTNLNKKELNQYVYVIRDTETVKDLEKKFFNAKLVCIVGNGGIATELAFSINFCKVIWILREQHITSTFLDPAAAHFFSNQINELDKTIDSNTNDLKMTKRLKYTITESKLIDKNNFGSALGPDWHQSIKFKGEHLLKKEISFEKNCEIISILKFEDIKDKLHKKNFSDEIENTWPIYIELNNGKIIGCDFIVNAIGVQPNILKFTDDQNNKLNNKNSQLLQLAFDGGILVDKYMRTSLLDVYAGGDVCTPYTNHVLVDKWLSDDINENFKKNQIITEHWHQVRLWTQARQMGIYMANSIAYSINENSLENLNLFACFDLFTHMTSFFGFKVILIGLFNGQFLNDDYEMLVRVEKNEKFMKLILKEGKVKGCILIGETELEETFENLINNQLDVSEIKDHLLDNTVDIEDYFD